MANALLVAFTLRGVKSGFGLSPPHKFLPVYSLFVFFGCYLQIINGVGCKVIEKQITIAVVKLPITKQGLKIATITGIQGSKVFKIGFDSYIGQTTLCSFKTKPHIAVNIKFTWRSLPLNGRPSLLTDVHCPLMIKPKEFWQLTEVCWLF